MPLRVAAYCRVSTDREDQANSLRSQQAYFTTYIRTHQDWILREVYADEGISGTSTRKREAFNRMIAQAEAGGLDLILTKEVSRFARNTVDTLEYTRKLKSLGVGVIFINDNIDTRENDGELRLTIMASIAQEESRKTSERVKWGQTRRMEAGVVFGNNSTYGFDTRGGQLFVKPEEAQVVRLIYHKFLNEGKGTHVIARELYEAGIDPPKTATGKWSAVMILRILRNEKHVGDLLQKKHVTPDYLNHKKVSNRGQEKQVMIQNHHEAIIDRETWDAAQRELARRSAQQGDKSKYSNRYWCSGKIYCGCCGSRFVLRNRKRPNGDLYMAWGCHSRVHYGNWKRDGRGENVGCNMRMVNDKSLSAIVRFVLGQLELDSDAIVAGTPTASRPSGPPSSASGRTPWMRFSAARSPMGSCKPCAHGMTESWWPLTGSSRQFRKLPKPWRRRKRGWRTLCGPSGRGWRARRRSTGRSSSGSRYLRTT